MTERPIRVGIVGAGENTRAMHIPGLRAMPGVEIVSLCNRRRASSDRVSQEFAVPRVYDTWQELVQAPDTDAILIGTWPYLHCPVTLAALEAGKHVLCEARMACDGDEARRMLAASREHPDLVTQVVPSPFSLGVDATIRRMLADGFLGDPLALEVCAFTGAFVDREAPMQWRQDDALSGRNVMSLGIWYEAVMRWVGQATAVAARGRVFVTQRADAETGEIRQVRIPEHLHVLADMACGAQAHFGLSAVSGLGSASEAWLFGSRGTLRFDGSNLYGGQAGDTELREIEAAPGEEGRWRVEEEFVNAIRGTEEISRTTFEDGVRYMAFTDAVARSVQEGREVAVES